MKSFSFILLSLPFICTATFSDLKADPVSDSLKNAEAIHRLDSVVKALDYKKGNITIGDNLASLNVPSGFAFLKTKDARFILEDVYGNPKDSNVLGMMVPENVSLLEGGSWFVAFSYDESGHVKDGDADNIKYDDLLDEMKKQFIAGNVERTKLGYKPIELVGWAKTPFYDKNAHKLHWAKELKFGTAKENTLNYNVRMLGRKGVLVLNIVSEMENLPAVEANIDKVISSTEFNSGNKYDDFDSNVDKVAEYGIGGLIAGGILLKTGLLAKLGILLLKLWKVIALAVVGVFGTLRKKLFGKKAKPKLSEPVQVINEPAQIVDTEIPKDQAPQS